MLYENDQHVKSTVSVQRVWHKLVDMIPFTVRLSQKLRSQSSTTKELQSSVGGNADVVGVSEVVSVVELSEVVSVVAVVVVDIMQVSMEGSMGPMTPLQS